MYIKHEQSQLPPFITLQKSLAEKFMVGELSISDIFILFWLSYLTNPVNHYAVISYPQLIEELRHEFSYANLRKILIKLKNLKLIWFEDRKGKSGTFKVWVHYYITKDKSYVDVEEIARQHGSQLPTKNDVSQSQILDTIHTLSYQEAMEKSGRNYDIANTPFTTPYTETDTENETDTERYMQSNSSSNTNSIGEILKAKTFQLGKDVRKRRKNQSN